jgi:SAM-dependent methyltransferase
VAKVPFAATTTGAEYTERLDRMSNARWKRLLKIQGPYRWNVRHLDLGRTLDVGCGLGRNLTHLGGHGIGVDTNPTSVRVCRGKGLRAYTAEEFFGSVVAVPESFDSLLIAHVLEHMSAADGVALVGAYLPFVRRGGRVVLITPQERGYASDPTHVRFVDFAAAVELTQAHGLVVIRQYSFPFPRRTGRVFPYNEFVTVARRP